MPSVSVVWKGNCRDPRTRYRLLGHLHLLAARNDEFLRLRQPERPRVLELVNAQRGGPARFRPNIETIDKEASGTILVSSFISPNPDALVASARAAGVALIENPEAGNPPLIALKQARLRGLDFKLFDPRGLYPGADRMSFVFLECRRVSLPRRAAGGARHARGLRGKQRRSAPRGADLYLCAPSVHLRHYLEDWTDCLFSWIKFFFIGDLWWHRREEMEGYSDYRQVFEDLMADRGAGPAEEATFDAVLATFAQHAEHWIGEVEGWAKAEQG